MALTFYNYSFQLNVAQSSHTAVGEYLMMLPQQLESGLLGEEGSEEAGQLVADWIDRVGAAVKLLVVLLSPWSQFAGMFQRY